MATFYISRERDPQSGASGGRLVLGVLELLSTINIVELEENGVAIGAFDLESGNFLRIYLGFYQYYY